MFRPNGVTGRSGRTISSRCSWIGSSRKYPPARPAVPRTAIRSPSCGTAKVPPPSRYFLSPCFRAAPFAAVFRGSRSTGARACDRAPVSRCRRGTFSRQDYYPTEREPCQPDAAGMANMAVFPVSRHGQRNGSRAPNLPGSSHLCIEVEGTTPRRASPARVAGRRTQKTCTICPAGDDQFVVVVRIVADPISLREP